MTLCTNPHHHHTLSWRFAHIPVIHTRCCDIECPHPNNLHTFSWRCVSMHITVIYSRIEKHLIWYTAVLWHFFNHFPRGWRVCHVVSLINSLRAKFFRGKINIYLHFMSLLHIDMTQVLKTLPEVRPVPTSFTQSISLLLMSWRRKEPGDQQQWYWPS